ncbi:UNVERIFIED_CONTAM: WD repeat-containing protein 43 [Siphonaria sp. JEL0065]|nr:WD repeat-containing protein 43 [Siphonaria sp. JEL0065]
MVNTKEASYIASTFSTDGRYFAAVTETGLALVFSVSSSSLLYSSQQGERATCVSLFEDFVAVGFSFGSVAVVEVKTGKAIENFELGSSVAAVAFDSFGSVAAVASNGAGKLFSKTLKSFEVAAASASFLLWDNYSDDLIVAGTKIEFVNAKIRFSGHAGKVVAAVVTEDRIVSAAKGDRFIAVWDKDSQKNTAALTLDAAPVALAISEKNKHILAVDEEGVLSVWNSLDALEKSDVAGSSTAVSSASKKQKKKNASSSAVPTRKPTTSVSIKIISVDSSNKLDESAGSRPASILNASFLNVDGSAIVFAYGSCLRPAFETISVLKRDHSGGDDGVDGDVDDDAQIVDGRIEVVRAAKGNSFVGLDELVARQLMTSTKAYSESNNAKVITSTTPFAMNTKSLSTPITQQQPEQQQEESLQDRLQTLNNLSLNDVPSLTSKKVSQKRHDLLKTPTATSLHNLLTQSVHSGDAQLLEQCLQVSDPVVITATVKRLPASQVVPLLNLLTVRLQMKPTRAKSLIEWVRAVVVCHAAFLMTNPSLVSHLSTLHSTLSTRTETFTKLLKLSGRLDLVTSQIALRASRAQIGDDDEGDEEEEREGVAVYDEENEDDEMDQDEEEEDEDLDSDEFGSEEEFGVEDPDFDEDADLDDDEEAEDEEDEGEDYE